MYLYLQLYLNVYLNLNLYFHLLSGKVQQGGQLSDHSGGQHPRGRSSYSWKANGLWNGSFEGEIFVGWSSI